MIQAHERTPYKGIYLNEMGSECSTDTEEMLNKPVPQIRRALRIME